MVACGRFVVKRVDVEEYVRSEGVVETEIFCEVTARMVVKKAAIKMKHAQVQGWLDKLAAVTARG